MSKTAKIIAVVLILNFMLTGCKSIPITAYSKEEIARIENIKEEKIEEDIYKEFLTLFKGFAGFDFDKYFFIPEEITYEETVYSFWNTSENKFYIGLLCVLPKGEAEELLGILRNKDYYKTYYTRSDLNVYMKENPDTHSSYLDTGRENKSECYYFSRRGKYVDTRVRRSITLEILPTDNTCNKYLVDFWASIGREPPEGQDCWSEDAYVYNGYEILLDKTGKPIG